MTHDLTAIAGMVVVSLLVLIGIDLRASRRTRKEIEGSQAKDSYDAERERLKSDDKISKSEDLLDLARSSGVVRPAKPK